VRAIQSKTFAYFCAIPFEFSIMQKALLLLALNIMACNTTQKSISENTALAPEAEDVSITYASTITDGELREHLYTYASDAFEGRETGTAGQKKASKYLKSAYEALGIPPALGEKGYFQRVPLEMARLPVGTITAGERTLTNGNEFLTFGSAAGKYDEVIYVGYGIETPDYSDYQGFDVAGKLVLIKAGEPKNQDGTYRLSGTREPSKWSNISEAISKRMEVAEVKGAKGILFVDDANFARYKNYFDNMKRNKSGRMELASEEEAVQLILLRGTEVAQMIPGWKNLKGTAPVNVDLKLDIVSENREIDSENVIAIMRGSQYPEEYVIISSHLDHIGINSDGAINNGADDDGSGTVAMLEIAEAFKEAATAGMAPKRSIVFLHVTGEEKGLLGSRYYTDHDPVFPLEQTVANLNIDMIGRTDPKRDGERNYIYLIGSDKLSTELHELSEAVNSQYTNIELDYTYNDENDPNRFYYRSDHYNFAKNNIPIIFYFNGTHVDYHRPGDTPDKIDYDLLENRSRLIFHTAWEIANKENRITVDKAAK
jgi:Zn-dependent M28 family amino/carboxypeptidase